MIIFYGIGNDEAKYLNTKHNAGRILVENLATLKNLTFKNQNGCFLAKNDDLLLVYPKGWVNSTGLNFNQIKNFFKLDPAKDLIILVQDDSDQKSEQVKLVFGGGSGGHKGIENIYTQTLNNNFWRLKIGIRPPENRFKSETFVLKNLTLQEKNNLQNLATIINQHLSLLQVGKIEQFQEIINRKNHT